MSYRHNFLVSVFSTKILQMHGIEMQTVFFGIANLLHCYFAGRSNSGKTSYIKALLEQSEKTFTESPHE